MFQYGMRQSATACMSAAPPSCSSPVFTHDASPQCGVAFDIKPSLSFHERRMSRVDDIRNIFRGAADYCRGVRARNAKYVPFSAGPAGH